MNKDNSMEHNIVCIYHSPSRSQDNLFRSLKYLFSGSWRHRPRYLDSFSLNKCIEALAIGNIILLCNKDKKAAISLVSKSVRPGNGQTEEKKQAIHPSHESTLVLLNDIFNICVI